MRFFASLFILLSITTAQVDYNTDIQPIFDNSCTNCHRYGNTSGGLNLESYGMLMSGNTVVAGDHASSVLWQRVSNGSMPPGANDLSTAQVSLIAQWIDEGALETPNTDFQPQSKQELVTAVNLWVSDNASALSTYGEINEWDVSLISDMSGLFNDLNLFNEDISSWNVSNVTDMGGIFDGAASFNADLSTWDVSSVTSMYNAFGSATSFNADISSWDVSSVSTMAEMFFGATSFNVDISSWDVSNVTDMGGMFWDAASFNADLSTWDVSSVTSMYNAFGSAASFNANLSSWDVSSVLTMAEMFNGATSFNADLSSWDVSNVTDMGGMFSDAASFNADLSAWDVSSVTNMHEMFYGTASFNQNISSWNVSNVEEMNNIFEGALAITDENKCAIHTSWSTNSNWPYDWSASCALTVNELSISPRYFKLHDNYPNPFNPTTKIHYDLPKNSFVSIDIYDVTGNKIKSLVNTVQDAGYRSVYWDATNSLGQSVSAGMYIYTVNAGEFRATRKMALIK